MVNKAISKTKLLSIWRLVCSTLAAFIGVQTEANRREDFKKSSPIPFIVMGIILAILLVLGLIVIVNLVLT